MNLWFIPAIMSVFGGIGEYKAGQEMKALSREQELLTEQNAVLEQRELDENIRREEIENTRVRGAALAKAGASGARVEGSVADYLSFIESEQNRNITWMRQAGESRVRINRQTGLSEARATRIQASAKKYGLLTGITGGFSFLAQGGMFKNANSTTTT